MSAQIFETDATHPHLTRLIAELDAYQYPLYPPESFQGINITELDEGEITCFMAAKWRLNRSLFGIRIDHDLACISDRDLA